MVACSVAKLEFKFSVGMFGCQGGFPAPCVHAVSHTESAEFLLNNEGVVKIEHVSTYIESS